jgi:hypothetical protein
MCENTGVPLHMSRKGGPEGESALKRVGAKGGPVRAHVGCDNAAMCMMLLRNMGARR